MQSETVRKLGQVLGSAYPAWKANEGTGLIFTRILDGLAEMLTIADGLIKTAYGENLPSTGPGEGRYWTLHRVLVQGGGLEALRAALAAKAEQADEIERLRGALERIERAAKGADKVSATVAAIVQSTLRGKEK